MKDKYHVIRMASFTLVVLLVILLVVHDDLQTYFLEVIQASLNYERLYVIIIVVSLIIGIFYSFYYATYTSPKDPKLLLKIFGPLFDPPANTLAYGLVIASVLRLIRGLFNQFFFDIEYFKDFGFINVSALGLACIPLLVWSVNGLSKFIFPLFVRRSDEFGEVTPILDEKNP